MAEQQEGCISDAAVRAKTGKTWAEWFSILDAAGAQAMSHQEIVAVLSRDHDVGAWWRQMVAVAYEQSRGLRQKHEKPDGYEVSVSKTIGVPVGVAYAAWTDESVRARWLGDVALTLRKATPDRTLRITWSDGGSLLGVHFQSRGDVRTQVTVQHAKLPDAAEAERMKTYWSSCLERLRAELEPPR